jgi:hypothetical protein
MLHRPELATPSVAAPLLSYSRSVVKRSAIWLQKNGISGIPNRGGSLGSTHPAVPQYSHKILKIKYLVLDGS